MEPLDFIVWWWEEFGSKFLTPTLLVALLTGTLTIVASVIATRMTQSHALKMSEDARRDSHRNDVRSLLAELIDTGRNWVEAMSVFVWVVGRSDDPPRRFRELYEGEDGTEMARYNLSLRRLFSEAYMSISDPDLLTLIESARHLHADYTEEVNGKILNSSRDAQGRADYTVLVEAARYVDNFRNQIEAIERRGAGLLRRSV